ncbi:Uncharacterised protein [Mycobacterium tuberculosis]|nr:Uncharacterised protein [Mycobacterium tuberculosis]
MTWWSALRISSVPVRPSNFMPSSVAITAFWSTVPALTMPSIRILVQTYEPARL